MPDDGALNSTAPKKAQWEAQKVVFQDALIRERANQNPKSPVDVRTIETRMPFL
jgi:hypothetical protein